jgi:hypothetical protein
MPGALDLPPVGTRLLARVEQTAVSYGITRDHMTEAAARAAAALCRKLLDDRIAGTTVLVLAGTGVKACVALHALRILHGFGASCSAVLTGGEREIARRPRGPRPSASRFACRCCSRDRPPFAQRWLTRIWCWTACWASVSRALRASRSLR